MKILYEENGNFQLADVIVKNDKSYHILINNKKIKIKNSKVFFELDKVAEDFLYLVNDLARNIDLDLLWKLSANQVININILSKLYFNKNPSSLNICAILIAIYKNPIYFNKVSKNFFQPTSGELLQKLKLAKEKKKRIELDIKKYCEMINKNIIPLDIKNDIFNILCNPNKQSAEYKTLKLLAKQEKITLIQLAIKHNLIDSYDKYLINSFIIKNYPQNDKNSQILININNKLNIYKKEIIKAFSIDDEQTIEIDDCFSLQTKEDKSRILGVHIALPVIAYDENIEKIICSRHSTLYLPNTKITMLPLNWIQQFSLQAGQYKFCMSIYININHDFSINNYQTALEQVFIENNLRIENLEKYYDDIIQDNFNPDIPYNLELNWLYKLAKTLNKERIDNLNLIQDKVNISFKITDTQIKLQKRYRGNPIDLIVSEISILVNALWSELLYKNKFPCIYRTQNKNLDKVQLTYQCKPHYGVAKKYYAWFTSPLRRSIDFYNQLSLFNFILHKNDLKLNNKDFIGNVISEFEIKNNLYNNFQKKILLHWSLEYIIQNNLKNLNGILLKNDLFKILELPIVVKVKNIPNNIDLSKSIKFKIKKIDIYDQLLELEC